MQVKYNDEQSLRRLGQWLRRKWFACHARLLEAQQELEGSKLTTDELRKEWDLQIKAQTKPLPRKLLAASLFYY